MVHPARGRKPTAEQVFQDMESVEPAIVSLQNQMKKTLPHLHDLVPDNKQLQPCVNRINNAVQAIRIDMEKMHPVMGNTRITAEEARIIFKNIQQDIENLQKSLTLLEHAIEEINPKISQPVPGLKQALSIATRALPNVQTLIEDVQMFTSK